ncbi:hypothetical protein HD806DRAFT_545366 [Xylariaceae sp. AK1471]|nr:hypothetical protein HD806DRAFT_545366 [Xylariaceae sp. AK1471]
MLSLSSLLNPAPPGPPLDNRFPPSPASSSLTDSCAEDTAFPDRPTMPKHKMPKDAAVFTKSKPKGAINFQPHESLDDVSLRLVQKFQIYPLGKIKEYSRHIPYNSGKKDFYEKTGRESFEVFQYVFKVPGDDAEYAVMWDYNVGLVRMTPFFKCCKYPKTTPAKMLNLNPGLKEITHSITGGSIMAQGYWMPYQCAKAICATFCQNIAGALIPIFGPEFPALCTPAEAPEYSRMIIDPAIIIQSTQEADYYRRLYSNTGSGSRNDNGNISPKRDRRVFRSPYDDSTRHHPRYRIRKTYITTPGSDNSPYATDTDSEISPVTDRSGLAGETPHHRLQRFPHSPMPPMLAHLRPCQPNNSHSGWTPANIPHSHGHPRPHSHAEYQASGPSPWLSAIPRFTTTAHLQASSYTNGNAQKHPRPQPFSAAHPLTHSHPQTYHPSTAQIQLPSPSEAPPYFAQQVHQSPRAKRPASQIEDDTGTSSGHRQGITTILRPSQMQNKSTNKENYTTEARSVRPREDDKPGGVGMGADKNAALLLMNLSVRDRSFWKSVGKCQTPEDADLSGLHGTTASRYNTSSSNDDNRNSRYTTNIGTPKGDGGVNPRHEADARTVKISSSGVTSEKTSPLDGTFPRIKRVRSSSM